MELIAHRGIYNKNILDNSLEALKKGLESPKYTGIECDIRMTKDKKFIIMHNSLFKGNLVKNMSYKEFLDIPLLEELLKINTKKILMLEIKDKDIDIKLFLKLLKKYKRNYYIMSFNNAIIKKLSESNKIYKYGVLNYVLNSDIDYKYDFLCILDCFANNILIRNLQKRGIEVIIYGTINVKKNVKYIVDDYKLLKK